MFPPLLFVLLLLPCLSLSDPNVTVYEILPKYGLPAGLLPDSVQSYSLSSTGEFTVGLAQQCYVQFDYSVYYDTQITGVLKYGSITNLKGIQVQRFFLWFDVDEIRVDLPPSDSIYFQVGLINKKLDVAQFQSVHSCSTKKGGLASCGESRKAFSEPRIFVEEAEALLAELITGIAN